MAAQTASLEVWTDTLSELGGGGMTESWGGWGCLAWRAEKVSSSKSGKMSLALANSMAPWMSPASIFLDTRWDKHLLSEWREGLVGSESFFLGGCWNCGGGDSSRTSCSLILVDMTCQNRQGAWGTSKGNEEGCPNSSQGATSFKIAVNFASHWYWAALGILSIIFTGGTLPRRFTSTNRQWNFRSYSVGSKVRICFLLSTGVYQWRVCNSIRALEKDDVRSRTSRLVVNYECKQSRDLPIVITICSYLAQTHHISVHRIQINEVQCQGKLWCIQLLHLRC